MKTLMFIIDLPFRFVFAFLGSRGTWLGRIILIVLVAFCRPDVMFAQTPGVSPSATRTELANVTSDQKQVAVLEAQLETMRQYDQRLLSTVYYALGALGGVVLLVVGLGWYTNFRIYRRDVTDLESSLRGQMNKMGKELESKVEKMERELESKLRRAAIDAGKSAVGSALYDLKKLQLEEIKREARDWEIKGVDANVLTSYARGLVLANEVFPDYEVPYMLDEIVRVLGKKKAILTASTIADVNKAVDTVSKEYLGTVERIRGILRESA
jgi:hypothetical protein